ncbi:unnamed protein product [Sphagnum jensenii]|uniref:Uncharacterized protein n=1 Tax=Sphagnum jensenii TaxID=128206 RepID=A0ABP0W604_9BRYO
MVTSFVENGALRGTSVAGAHDLPASLASSIPTPHVYLAARSKFQVFAQISVAKFAKRRQPSYWDSVIQAQDAAAQFSVSSSAHQIVGNSDRTGTYV